MEWPVPVVKLSLIIVGVKMSCGIRKLRQAVQCQVDHVKMSRTQKKHLLMLKTIRRYDWYFLAALNIFKSPEIIKGPVKLYSLLTKKYET